MKIKPERYPFIWSLDTKSTIKSLWLGWILITWCYWPGYGKFFDYEITISWKPGL